MMRRSYFHWAACAIAALFLTACGKTASDLDLSSLETAFQSAPSELKQPVEQATAELKAGEFGKGMATLRDAARKGKMSEDQIQAFYDTITEVQLVMSENPKFASDEAYAAIRDLGRLLEAQRRQ